MLNQLRAVLGSYGQRSRSLVFGTFVVTGLVQVVVTLLTAPQPNSAKNSFPFIAMGSLFLGMQLWMHLREQLLSTRRFLWPRYLQPQLIVFSMFAILLTVAWPIALEILHGGGTMALMPLSSAFFAAIGWCIVTLSPVLMVVLFVAYLSMCFGIAVNIPAMLDLHPVLGAAVMVISLLLSFLAVWRLTRIDETVRSYGKLPSLQGSGVLPKMTGQLAQPQATWSGVRSWFIPRLESYLPRPAGQWERSRRWRRMRPSPLWFAAFLSTAMVLPQLLVSNFIASSGQVNTSFLFPLFMVLFISGNSVTTSWLQNWRYMELEFTRPIDRRTLLKDLALSIAIQSLQVWMLTAIVLLVALAYEGVLKANVPGVAAFVAVSFAGHLLNLVVALRVMPLRSPGGVALAGFPVSIASGAIAFGCFTHPSAAPWIASAGIAGLLLLATALLPITLRLWDRTDLG